MFQAVTANLALAKQEKVNYSCSCPLFQLINIVARLIFFSIRSM